MLNFRIQPESAPYPALRPAGSPAGQQGEPALKPEDHFAKLFDELRIPLSRYLRRIGLSQEDSEEIVQETFLRLIERLREKGREGNLHGWAFRVAHNLAIDKHRDQGRFTTKSPQEWDGLSDLLRDQAPNPEEFLLSKERTAEVVQAIYSLSGLQLQCALLRLDGFRYREIGEILGVSMATVAESLRRAIHKIARN